MQGWGWTREAATIWARLSGSESGDVALALVAIGQDQLALDHADAAVDPLRRALRIV